MAIQEQDEVVQPNDTFAALLRKLEDGEFINVAGHEVQSFFAKLRALAFKKNGRAVGKITIEIKLPMSKDGYAMPVASITCKLPSSSRDESMIYVDEDGDLMARPIEKQLTMKLAGDGQVRDPAAVPAKGM